MTGQTLTCPRFLLLLFGFGIAAASAACDLAGTRGEGAVKTDTRDVGAFSRIETGAGIGVTVRVGPARALEVHAQENLLPIIVTEVQNDTLFLRSAHVYTTSEKVEVVLTTPTLSRIVLSGGSRGSIDGLAANDMEIELSGGSRLTATGDVEDLTLGMSGGSTATLDGLSTSTIRLDASGGSTATVRAAGEVRGSASGGARITVLGAAKLTVDTTGGSDVDRG
jgi:hypothetical protein